MLQPPQILQPPNPEASGVLPPVHVQVTSTPDAVEVRQVFPQAIEVSDMMSLGRGFGAFGGAVSIGYALMLSSGLPRRILSSDGFGLTGVLGGLSSLVMLLVGWWMFRSDTTGLRYEPVLFCRGGPSGPTVHHMYAGSFGLNPFKRVPVVINSHPWSCVRAELTSAVIGGAPFINRQYFLTLAITDAPGSNRVIDRFKVGLADTGDGTRMVNFWEHLRRYMQEGGPPLSQPGTEGWVPAQPMPLWWALLSYQVIGPDADLYEDMPLWGRILTGMLLALGAPFFATFGFFRWLSLKLKKEPRWPAEILAMAGGAALTGEEIARYDARSAVARRDADGTRTATAHRARRKPVMRLNGEIIDPEQ